MTRQGPLAERCPEVYKEMIWHSQAFPLCLDFSPMVVAMGRLKRAQPVAPRPSRPGGMRTPNYASPLVAVRASTHIGLTHGPRATVAGVGNSGPWR